MALDQSGSMKEPADDQDTAPKMDALRRAATLFIDKSHPQAETALLPFSTRVGALGAFTRNKAALKTQVANLKPEGETAFLDATYDAVAALDAYNPPGKRFVVVLTDGKDNSSRHRQEDVIARARDADVVLHMLAFGRKDELDAVTMSALAKATHGSFSHAHNQDELIKRFQDLSIELHTQGIDEKALQQIAQATGGKYLPARDVAKLRDTFKVVVREVQENYTTMIVPSRRQAQDGTRREISISVEQELSNERDAHGKARRVQVSETKKSDVGVRGLVVPQMHSLVYLGFLGGLGLLIAAPAVLRRRKRSAEEV